MRMSCNGCRVLRKGCSEDCSIRPCLQWIKSSESQANATLFLAKFYGRAGLLNLINAGPQHLRPAIFQSMLYEACGRIVNPIHGSIGLLWYGNWQLCQSAVEAILNGDPIKQISSEDATAVSSSGNPNPPFKAYDIRHVFKDDKKLLASQERHRVKTTRNRFKRAGNGTGSISKTKPASRLNSGQDAELVIASDSAGTTGAGTCNLRWKKFYPVVESEEMVKAEPSHDSSVSQQEESMVSVETVEGSGSGYGSVVNRVEMEVVEHGGEVEEDVDGSSVNLDLTLGFSSMFSSCIEKEGAMKGRKEMFGGGFNVGLAGLELKLNRQPLDQ